LDDGPFAAELDASGPAGLAEIRMTVDLRPIANSMNRFR